MASRVAIVGAGWAGIACAIAAAKAGAHVDVYERGAEVEPFLGDPAMHVDVMPDMMRSLSRLGVAEACARGGFPYRGVTVTDAAGRLRDEIACVRLAEAHLPVAVGLLGSALGAALLEAAGAQGVRIHWQAAVQAVSFDDASAMLHLDGGIRVAADMTLLATGGGALCRGAPFESDPAAEQVTWWCGLVQRPPGLDQPRIVMAGIRSKFWLVPLSGATAGLSLIDDDLQGLNQASISAAQVREWLRRHACRAEWMVPQSGDEIVLRPMHVHAGMRPLPWHRGNLLCVGAAAHGLPPHFSQPAAQAFEDAVVFGDLFAARPPTPDLMQAFVQRRQPRVKAVFEVSARALHWDRHPNHGAGLTELAGSMAAAVAAPA